LTANHTQPWLIQGGLLVDGTGAPAIPADVRIREGVITEIGQALAPMDTEHVMQADGCIVSPGFIETHTHFDAAMWWDPNLDPLPGFGVTTTIMGNCGFSIAPVSEDEAVRREVIGIFSFFEDIPTAPFLSELPWDWSTWPEYKESMTKSVSVPTNYAAFCGHIALRLTAMGMDAWDRAATPEEIAIMAKLLDEALSAGALGLSSNLFDHDGNNRPVPSLKADDDEFRALFEVLENHPDTCFQVIVDVFRDMTAPESVKRIAHLTEGLALRVQWGGLPTLVFQRDMIGIQAPLIELHEQLKRDGRDFWTAFAHVPVTTSISVQNSLLFAQSNDYVWHEVVVADTEAEKIELLQDPDWRKRARLSWDNETLAFSPFPKGRAETLQLINSDNGTGPIGLTLGEYQEVIGAEHPSDAMAQWFIRNGLDSTVTMPPFEKDEEMVIRLLRDPNAVGNVSDAGAHGQMLCGGGENIKLLTQYVRETGQITLEEAVHSMTGKIASHFRLNDRGILAVGKRADITVFHMDEIVDREMKRAYDVPNGKGGHTWRWTRDPAPMRLTMVNGTPTFMDGEYTGARSGEMLRPG
jgi:N-acyl-D-amino-acid deacylase